MAVLRLSDDHHVWLAHLSSEDLINDDAFVQFLEDIVQSLLELGHKIALLGKTLH